MQAGKPVQTIGIGAQVELPVADLANFGGNLKRYLAGTGDQPFDLRHGPLFRTTLIRVSDTEHVLFLAAHHLVFDVESVWIFLREVARFHGAQSYAPDLPIQYADFAAWQRARSEDDADEAGQAYWKRQLDGAPSLLDLPVDKARNATRHFQSVRQDALLPAELSAALKSTARKEGVTPFVFLLSTFSVLLARYTGQDDVLIGSPVSGRTRPETESLIGSFAYPLVLRADLSGRCTFRDVLQRLRDTTLGAFEHQNIPFGRVLELARPERRPGTSPLFQAMFTYPPTQPSIALPGLTFSPMIDLLEAAVEYDLFLSAVESDAGLAVALTYPDDLFEDATVGRMLTNFVGILRDAIRHPGAPVASLAAAGAVNEGMTRADWFHTRFPLTPRDCVLVQGNFDWPVPDGVRMVRIADEDPIAAIVSNAITVAFLERRSLEPLRNASGMESLRHVFVAGEPLRNFEGLHCPVTSFYVPFSGQDEALFRTIAPHEPATSGYIGIPAFMPVGVAHDGLGPAPDGVIADVVAGHDGKPTGVRGRRLSDGTIEVPGSVVDFARMETALRNAPAVGDCAVLLRGSELIAYVVPSGHLAPDEIRAHLEKSWGENMIPRTFLPVSNIPLTAKGAVDTEALSRLPVIDAAWIKSAEQRSQGRIVIAVQRDTAVAQTPLHLSDLLPEGERHATHAASAANPAANPEVNNDKRPEVSAEEIANRPLAISDGGPLTIPPDAPATFTEAILRTAAQGGERGRRGITFVGSQGEAVHQSYAELLNEAKRVLAGLQAAGFRPKDRIILQSGELRDHFAAFWGCVLGGIVPVTVAVPPAYTGKNGVVNKLHNTWKLLERPAILSNAALAPAIEGLAGLMSMEGLRVLTVESLKEHGVSEDIYPSRPEDLVFFQLTSGSTGTPKCIQETHRAIIAHIHGSQQFNGYRDDDVNLNWLPMDHVVPILTCHLKDVYLGCDEIQVRTELILANPVKWLDLMERFRVTHSWAPNFGFKLVADALKADALKSGTARTWDLSPVRFLMNAGEQVTTTVVRDFLAAVSPFGIGAGVMQPSFGMAEACTCMTYQNAFDLQTGHRNILKSTLAGALVAVDGEDETTANFVDLGPPMAGIQIRIADSENQVRREGFIGRFQIKGPVITPGYLYNEEANREAFVGDGWLNTGDIGFIMDGRLFLTGREKETIIVRGANFYCYEIEDVVNGVAGVEPTFSAACGIPDPVSGTEELGIFFVPGPGASALQLIQAIRTTVARGLGINPAVIVPLEKKDFPKTTSGKIQRTQLKKSLEAGQFDGLLKELDLRAGNANTLPDWFYRRVWRRRTLRAGAEFPERVLLFDDASGLGEKLIEKLDVHGVQCIRATNPDALHALARDGVRIDRVIDLRPYRPEPEAHDTGTTSQAATFAMLDLARALQEYGDQIGSPGLLVASNGAQAATEKDEIRLSNASLPGLLRTMPRELPWLRCRHVDMEPGDPEGNVALLLEELRANDGEAEIAWRGGRRYAGRLTKVSHPPVAQKRPAAFKRRGAYLLSGGLGGIGVEIARHLLERYDCRLLIVGTTALTGCDARSVERAEALAALRRACGEVRYAQVDICDAARLKSVVNVALAEWKCGLDGVIHLAGVMRESALAEETHEGFAESMRAKIPGTWALHELVKDKPGALFIHFSSANGFFGGFRVGAYSAANAFLDRFAHFQRTVCGLRSYSLAWSMWDEVGMSRGYPFKELSRSRGFLTVNARQGLQSMLVALRQEPSDILIGLDGTKADVRQYVEGKPWNLVSLRGWYASDDSGPRQVLDRFDVAVPCDFRPAPPQVVTAAGTIDRERLFEWEKSQGAQPERAVQPRSELEQTIARLWKELLKTPDVGVNDNFFDLGGHSMLLMQVHGRLQEALGRDFPMLDLLSHPTIAALAAHLGRESGADASLEAGKSRAEMRHQSVARRGRARAAARAGAKDN